jgi:hypothetical protein
MNILKIPKGGNQKPQIEEEQTLYVVFGNGMITRIFYGFARRATLRTPLVQQ